MANLGKVVYLDMPVPFDVKREWNSKGYKVVDSVFEPKKPADEKPVKAKSSAK